MEKIGSGYGLDAVFKIEEKKLCVVSGYPDMTMPPFYFIFHFHQPCSGVQIQFDCVTTNGMKKNSSLCAHLHTHVTLRDGNRDRERERKKKKNQNDGLMLLKETICLQK